MACVVDTKLDRRKKETKVRYLIPIDFNKLEDWAKIEFTQSVKVKYKAEQILASAWSGK